MNKKHMKTNKITSIGIRSLRDKVRELGSTGSGDNKMTLYACGDGEKGREVIETNGDPVWDCEEGFDIIREQIMGGQ